MICAAFTAWLMRTQPTKRFCHYAFGAHRCINTSPCPGDHICACGSTTA